MIIFPWETVNGSTKSHLIFLFGQKEALQDSLFHSH